MVFGRFKKNDRSDALERLANAPVGAPVSVEGRRGVIRGTMHLAESGDRWVEHLVDDADGNRFWLSVENWSTTTATLWTDVEVWAVNGGPDDRRVSFEGVDFRRVEDGTVEFQAMGDVDVTERGTIDYVDFRAGDGRRLGFERFGEEGAGRRSRATTGVCPDCHAPLEIDAAGKCSSCGSAMRADHGWWGSWEVAVGRDVTDSAGLQ